MANTFKSAMVDITTTGLTTVLTVPTANPGATPPVPPTTDVVKSLLVCNDSGSTTLVDVEVVRGASTFEIFKSKSVATVTTTELLTQPLIVEGGKTFTVLSSSSDSFDVAISYLNIKKEVTT